MRGIGKVVTVSILVIFPAAAGCMAEPEPGTVEFIESWPEGTVLDLPDLRDAKDVWPEVMAGANGSIDVASFYYSRLGDGKDAQGPKGISDFLVPVLEEIADAATGRGVPVRILADSKFYQNYGAVPDLLGELPGAETRIFDVGHAWGSGVLHAKYFLVDEDILYLGSQNWDWRSLGQIHELGVLVRDPGLKGDLARIFQMDWDLAAAGAEPLEASPATGQSTLVEAEGRTLVTPDGAEVTGLIAASPPQALPDGIAWDLPWLIEMIDAAVDSVHIQMLSYGTTDRERRLFDDLDRAMRRAAVRGAEVRLMVANWSLSKYQLPWLQSLAAVPGIEVRFTSIPEHPDGFIPYARVEHAKIMTVDGRLCWIGTSNWSRDYFHASRNVSLFLKGAGATAAPDRFFNLSWLGPYARTLEACGDYAPPRRN